MGLHNIFGDAPLGKPPLGKAQLSLISAKHHILFLLSGAGALEPYAVFSHFAGHRNASLGHQLVQFVTPAMRYALRRIHHPDALAFGLGKQSQRALLAAHAEHVRYTLQKVVRQRALKHYIAAIMPHHRLKNLPVLDHGVGREAGCPRYA